METVVEEVLEKEPCDIVRKLLEADEEVNSVLKAFLEREPPGFTRSTREFKRKLIRRFSPEFQPSDLPVRRFFAEGNEENSEEEEEETV